MTISLILSVTVHPRNERDKTFFLLNKIHLCSLTSEY